MKIIVFLVVTSICFLCKGEVGKCDVCGSPKGYFSLKVNKSTMYLCTKHICNKHSCPKDKKGVCEKCAAETNQKKATQQNARVKDKQLNQDKLRSKILEFKKYGNGVCGRFKNRLGGITSDFSSGLYLYKIADEQLSVVNSGLKQLKQTHHVLFLCDIYGNYCFVVVEFKFKANKKIVENGIIKLRESVKQALDPIPPYSTIKPRFELGLSSPIVISEEDVLDLSNEDFPIDVMDTLWNIESTVVFDNITVFKANKKVGCYKTTVTAKLDDYYNWCYDDCEDTHISVSLYEESEGSLSGYASRDSTVGKKLYSLLQDGKEHKIEVYVCHPISMVMNWENWCSEIVDIVSFKEIK